MLQKETEKIADGFVQSGGIVYYVDILEVVKNNITTDPSGRSKAVVVDLTDKDKIFQMICSIDEIDVLVNNAGVALPADGNGNSDEVYEKRVWSDGKEQVAL